MNWRLAGTMASAFVLWNLLLWPVLPDWADLVARVATALWNLVTPHGQTVAVTSHASTLVLRWTPVGAGANHNTGLLTFNVVLYLTAWSAATGVPLRARLRWLIVAMPIIACWHVADLLLTVESLLLTRIQPQGYDLGTLSLWFLTVKFANHLTVLGLRQVVPLLLLAAQWLHWRGHHDPARTGRRPFSPWI